MTHNRIIAAIDRMRIALVDKVHDGLVTPERLAASHKALDMELDDYMAFQNLKSVASLDGTLTLDEAMTVYDYLGENGPSRFNAQPLEVKAVLTQVLAELASLRIKQV